jgi:hypothetical protein
MEEIMNIWLGSVIEVTRRVPFLAFGIVLVWFLLPFITQMVIHPDDVIRLQHYIEGNEIPRSFGAQQITVGLFYAVTMIVVLGLLLLGLLTVLYHRLQFALTVWPVAAIALGLIGNLIWSQILAKQFPQGDLPGILVGFGPAIVTIVWQRAAEGWAQDFVFGRGQRPPRNMSYR